MRTDHLNRPARGWVKQPHFVKLYLCGNGVTFQAQPLAQCGQADAMIVGKILLAHVTLMKTGQQLLPLFGSPTAANRYIG